MNLDHAVLLTIRNRRVMGAGCWRGRGVPANKHNRWVALK